ncbi:MAG: glycosyltransferase [Clostridiales bacterium]|nr:glycosyltransferase [Clostridiales bacterium]
MGLKVLHISKYYYPFSGGTEQIARDIVLSLKEVPECDQLVFAFDHGSPKESKDSEDVVDDIKVIRCRCFAKISSQSISASYGRRLREAMDDFKPDIVILHYPNPFGTRYLLKALKTHPDTKLITYWHLDIVKQKFLKVFFKGQNRRLIARSSRLIATSPNYVKGSEWLSSVPDKCVVIPNCINENRLEINDEVVKRAEELKTEYNGKTACLAVGRHVEYKGFKYLIEASGLLGDDYVIDITGKGPLTDELKELAKGDDKVHFLGLVSDVELRAKLMACDIFCFPSVTKNEAFGLALAEGMYFGKPAVTFTIEGSGVNYVNLNGVTGLECPNSDSKAYAEAIRLLASDSAKRTSMGAAAKARVIDNFTFATFKKNIQDLVVKL